jgi:hypothetical protein
LEKVKDQRRASEEALAQKEQTLRNRIEDRIEEIRLLLEGVPEAQAALPSLRAVNKALGKQNRLDLIKKLQSLLAG